MANEVLATVAGREITEEILNAYLKNVPEEQQMYASNPAFRQHYLDQLIAMYAFAQMGEDEKLDETEEFQKVIESAKRDILAQMAMREVLKDITVTDEEVRAYYDENRDKFRRGETVSAKHILTETEEECKSVLAEIESGAKTFEEAARAYSTCPSKEKGGDLGAFGRGQMVKEFEDAAFAAEVDKVAGPVKTQFGYHLIKVEEKTDAAEVAFEQVSDKIRTQLLQKKQNDAYNAKVQELKEKYMK